MVGEWFMAAFWELHTERRIGPGFACQIPWSSIDAYARSAGLAYDVSDALRLAVRALDAEWLKARKADLEQEAREAEWKARNGGGGGGPSSRGGGRTPALRGRVKR